MTESNIHAHSASFNTQQYGPLYIVAGSHARGRTFHAYLLDPGQKVPASLYEPNNKHQDVAEHQQIYGVINGIPGWTEEYGWIKNHPAVQDGSATKMLVQLVEANQMGKDIGMLDPNIRRKWLATWAEQNLCFSPLELYLPVLDEPLNTPFI